jgi:hypothetical protein
MHVDRTARLRFAEVLRHFAAGRLTNEEYEADVDKLLDSPDRSIWAVWWSVWPTYHDCRTHRMVGHWELTKKGRRTVARMIVFLHSGLPFEWPRTPGWRILLGLLTLGLWNKLFSIASCGGDESVWPFFRDADLRASLARPRLLGGAN